jgi:hypothetical protein
MAEHRQVVLAIHQQHHHLKEIMVVEQHLLLQRDKVQVAVVELERQVIVVEQHLLLVVMAEMVQHLQLQAHQQLMLAVEVVLVTLLQPLQALADQVVVVLDQTLLMAQTEPLVLVAVAAEGATVHLVTWVEVLVAQV